MTWANTKRVRVKQGRRAAWHQQRIAEAGSEKRALSAACQWLISEAWLAGCLPDALDHVLTYIDQLRKEARHDDDNGA